MKRILFSFTLLLFACSGFAQKGFGIDGSIGIGRNGGDLVYPFLLEGRAQFNDYLSVNLGFGLWNSGFKGNWEGNKTETAFTLYRLSSTKMLPSLQAGIRGQIPVFRLNEKQVRFFVEPKLYFLPFSAQTVNLKEIYYEKKAEETIYKATEKSDNTQIKSECHPRLYGGLQLGLAFELINNVDLAISYGYTKMDLFKDLRDKSIEDKATIKWPLNTYLPDTDLQLINISFLINFDLN